MKLFIGVLIACFLIPSIAHAAFLWDTGNPSAEERYIGCVDDLVQMRADCQQQLTAKDAEVDAMVDARNDAIAIAGAGGLVVGTGGAGAVSVAVGSVSGAVGAVLTGLPPVALFALIVALTAGW